MSLVFRKLVLLPLSAVVLAGCGATVSISGGNGGIYKHSPTPATTTKQPKKTSALPTVVTVTSKPGSATWVAAQYVAAQSSVNWSHLFSTKTHYAEWTSLIKPYVTSSMWAGISSLQQSAIKLGNNSPKLAPMSTWIAEQRIESALIIQSSVMTAAGVTPTSEVVQVVYKTLKTGLGISTEEAGPVQIEQLKMQKVGGNWLVAQQYSSVYN
jgi:hypothetical protein